MSDIKYAYYESSVGYKITGKTTTDVLVSGGSKALSDFYTTSNPPPDNNTTYSAGTGLTLSGTTFGQTITTSGTGSFITGITQTAEGFQINLGTPPNTTYSLATATTPGLVELFSNTQQAVAAAAVSATVGRTYGVQMNSDNQLVVNVPWVDTNTNTTYSAGNGLTLSGTTFSLPVTITGLGNVVSSVTQTATGITVDKSITAATTADLDDYILLTQKGAINGVATLDASGLVPSSQLPSYVDDIIEAATLVALNALPAGEKVPGKIYVTLDNNKTYRWGGSAFVEVSSGAIGLASSTVPGIVELFSDTTQNVAANSVSATAARTYGVQVNSVGQMVVNVPWVDTDTNTTYAGSTSIALTGGTFQRAALTGDVTAPVNNNTTTIANNVVTNAKLADMGANTIKGAIALGDPVDLTPAQVRTMLGMDAIVDTQPAGSAVTKTITHNWNTRRINVLITDTVTFYKVEARIKMTTVNTLSIEFDSQPPNALEITLTKMA